MKLRWVGLASAAVLAFSSLAQAESPVALRLDIGYPITYSDVNSDRRVNVKSKYDIGMELSKSVSQVPLALGVYYGASIGGDFGQLPINHTGVLMYYYPFGAPYDSKTIDNNVFMKVSRISPFIRVAMGLTFINFRDAAFEDTFGASAFNYQLAGGFDYPINDLFLVGTHINYLTTFGGQRALSDTDTVGVNLTTFSFAVRMTYLWR